MTEKEYISRRDLRELGYIDSDTTFNPFHKEVNEKVSKAVENELKTEIKTNHTRELYDEYVGMLESNGFSSAITQDWLKDNVPALHQIEIEWREIVLADIMRG